MMLPPFYPILDSDTLARRGCPSAIAAEALLEAGVKILQLRHKDNFDRETFETAGIIAALCRQAGALFVINDRADIARLLNAALHLGQSDLPPGEARKVTGPNSLLGYSTHNEQQLAASTAEQVDYVALGPIFDTASKTNPDPVVGVETLRRLRPITARPLVAIGGITRQNARQALDAGADSVAIIGDLYPHECTRASIRERAEEWMKLTNANN